MKGRYWIIIVLAAIIAISLPFLFHSDNTAAPAIITAAAAEGRIGATLALLNASDAVLLEGEQISDIMIRNNPEMEVYGSTTSDYQYNFRKDTGYLSGIRRVDIKNAEENMGEPLPDNRLSEIAHKLAHTILEDSLTGELIAQEPKLNGDLHRFIFKEFRDGIPTGTRSTVTLYSDGTLFSATFNRTQQDLEANAKKTMLTQEEAIAIATREVTPFAKERGEYPVTVESVEITANTKATFYEVVFSAECSCGTEDCLRYFAVTLDAYTGKIDGVAYGVEKIPRMRFASGDHFILRYRQSPRRYDRCGCRWRRPPE